MPIDIAASFSFGLSEPTDVLLQFEAAAIPEQQILASDCRMSEAEGLVRVPAQDAIGERIWLRAEGLYEVEYSAQVQVERMARHENKRIPADLDFSAIRGLKKEAQVNFAHVRPATLGQAGRISGITPADVAVLAVWMEKGERQGAGAGGTA